MIAMAPRVLTNRTTLVKATAEPVETIFGAPGPELRVQIGIDADQWVAWETKTGSFGEGATREAAAADLGKSLMRLHKELRKHRDSLAPRLLEQFRALEAVYGQE